MANTKNLRGEEQGLGHPLSPLDLIGGLGGGSLVRALMKRLGGKAVKEGADEMSQRDTADAQAYEQDYHQRKEEFDLGEEGEPSFEDWLENAPDDYKESRGLYDELPDPAANNNMGVGADMGDQQIEDLLTMSDPHNPDVLTSEKLAPSWRYEGDAPPLLQQLFNKMRGNAANVNRPGIVK